MNEPLSEPYRIAAETPPDDGATYALFLSNAFAALPSGKLVAAAPVVRRGEHVLAHHSHILVTCSSDGGRTWKETAKLAFHSLQNLKMEVAFFPHEGKLYMLIGPRTDEGRILVSVSDDEALTWSEPIEVICVNSGGIVSKSASASEPLSGVEALEIAKEEQHWYCLHQTAMVVRNGYLYFAVSETCQKLAVASCELAKGVSNPDAWRISASVEMPIPDEVTAGLFPGQSMRCLEGNIIQVGGRLRVMARAVIDRQGTSNLAAVFELEDDGASIRLAFAQFYPLPGGQCKFYIVYDEKSRLYWMASNLPANSQGLIDSPENSPKGNDRRFLMLWYACDSLNWFPAGCITHAGSLSEAFMYPSFVIQDEDILLFSRTSLPRAGAQEKERLKYGHHDANFLTFHRIRDFRRLAMNIWPM